MSKSEAVMEFSDSRDEKFSAENQNGSEKNRIFVNGSIITVAPFFNVDIRNRGEAEVVRRSALVRDYLKTMITVADTFGIKLQKVTDNIGGFKNEDGERMHEASYNILVGEEVSPETARLFGALLADLSPEVQEAVIVASDAKSDADLNSFGIGIPIKDVNKTVELLTELGDEYADFNINENDKEVSISVFPDYDIKDEAERNADFERRIDELKTKINRLKDILDERGIGFKDIEPSRYKRNSAYCSARDRAVVYKEWLETYERQEVGDSNSPLTEAQRELVELAQKRNAQFRRNRTRYNNWIAKKAAEQGIGVDEAKRLYPFKHIYFDDLKSMSEPLDEEAINDSRLTQKFFSDAVQRKIGIIPRGGESFRGWYRSILRL